MGDHAHSRSLSPSYRGYKEPLKPSNGNQWQQSYDHPGERETQSQYLQTQQGTQPYQPLQYERKTLEQNYKNQNLNHSQQPYKKEAQQQHYQDQIQQTLKHQRVTKQPLNYHGESQEYQGPLQSFQDQPQDVHEDHPQSGSYSNPKIAFFHVLFKGMAIFFYIFGGWFTSSFVLQFVVIVLLVAVDFWIVKNVSGRILVGLRYWNENDEQGNNLWRFESLEKQSLDRLNKSDTTLFWTSLYVVPGIWTVFGIVAALKFSFDYLLIVVIALILCTSNIIGFTKCRKDAKKKVQNFAQQAMGGLMREAVTGGISNSLSKAFNVF